MLDELGRIVEFGCGCGRCRFEIGRRFRFFVECFGQKFRQVFPEEVAAIDDLPTAHVEEVYGEHLVFVVVAEDVCVLVVGGGDPLLVLHLVDGDDLVTEACGQLELLGIGGVGHPFGQEGLEFAGPSFEEELDVSNGLFVGFGGCEAFDAGAEAALDVVLKAGARMIAREINLAGGDEEAAVDEIDEAMGEVAWEVGTEVGGTVFTQTPGNEDFGIAVAHGELDIGVGLVVAKKDVEAGLALLDEVVFEGEGFALVVDGDVFDVDSLAHEGAGLGVGLGGFEEVGAYAGAEVFGLADVDDLAFGILVEVATGLGWE